jgi:FMN phosphatase YigB (HAD superfamily)
MSKSQQLGGIKIVYDYKVVSNFDHKALFIDILRKATSIETVSVASLTGLILRINIPEALTPFRSDVFGEGNGLLNSENYMLPETGMKINQLVLKCCIIQELSARELELDNFDSKYRKKPAKLSEMIHEFKAQRYAYKETLKLGGSPVCPDAVAFVKLSSAEFERLFFEDETMPDIYANNAVFQYISNQLEDYPNIRAVSFTLMESVSPEYESLSAFVSNIKLLPPDEQQEKLPIFHDLALRVLAIYVVLFYCAGIIQLDGHLGNWMYLKEVEWSKLLPIEQTMLSPFLIRAIDFGQFFLREKDVGGINQTTKKYFQRFTDSRPRRLEQFANILGVEPDFIRTAEEAGDAFENVFEELNRSIAQDPHGSILWEGNTVVHPDLQIDESMMIIHKILFLGMLVDSFYNTVRINKEEHRFQMRTIFDAVYGGDCHTPIDMMNEQLGQDLHAYMSNLVDEDQDEMRFSLNKIKKYIGDYLNWKDDFITHIYFDWSGTLAKPGTRETFAFGKTREEQLSVLYDETISLLDYLNKKGYILGIISNTSIGKTNFIEALKNTGLFDYFQGTITVGDDAQMCRKGCSEIFESTLRNDGVSPGNALMVGDDYLKDIVSSHNLHMSSILIDRTNMAADKGVADLKINNLNELKKYF